MIPNRMRITLRKLIFSHLGSIRQEKGLAGNKGAAQPNLGAGLRGICEVSLLQTSRYKHCPWGNEAQPSHLCALLLSVGPRENPAWAFIPPACLLCHHPFLLADHKEKQWKPRGKKSYLSPNPQLPNPNITRCQGRRGEERARFGGGGR